MSTHKPVVLILCTGNSCRSQMAEGFLRQYAGDRFDVRSAGMEPKAEVHPLAVQVMGEIGIDISHQRPKSVGDFLGKIPVLHLLIVCDKANNTCPRIWPGAYTRAYMPFDDPAAFHGSAEETLNEFRRVRDLIGRAMQTWQPQLTSANRQHQE
ncbi:MAG: arsenate reductase ArsC [Tepidisphaerales bacterium]